MSSVEVDIKKSRPGFDVANLLGSKLDLFGHDGSQQQTLLDNLNTSHSSKVEISGLTFRLVVNPVYSANDERLGTVVEWTNQTTEVRSELEIDEVVNAATQGDFTSRIPIDDKQGFFERLSTGINQILEDKSSGFDGYVQGD